MRLRIFAAVLLLACTLRAGTPLEDGFTDTTFTAGLDQPVQMAWAPDASGRLFVTEKTTGVRIIENGALLATPFATFSPLFTDSECGVLGLCFDNNYAQNKYVYVFVTVSSSEQRIVRFTDVNDLGTARTTILGGLPTEGINHDGGALAMGPDGCLYFAIGDNGIKKGVDNDLTTLAAKVGRCNADGTVPNDNPFNDGPGPRNDYIYASGFRNPFTLTFQPGTGQLWLNVVGSTPDGQTAPHSTAGYEQVFVVHAGDDGGYDDYEGNQPAGARYNTPFTRPLIRPKIQYKTDYFGEAAQKRTLASGSRANGIVTFKTTTAHPFRVGQAVEITGAGALNGTYAVSTVPNTTSFTAPAPGTNAGVSTGNAAPLVQGGCITGGTFYDSTAFPAAYRGNFFYGDLNSGLIMRATLDTDNKLKSLGVFLTDAGAPTDTTVGPDGALYYLDNNSGEVHRVAFDAVQGLILSRTALAMQEGESAQFTVRLGAPPVDIVPVQIHKTGDNGDGTHDLAITAGDTLTFTPDNYDQPQAVTVTALPDYDTTDDTATFTVTAPGIASVDVSATAIDQNLGDFVLSDSALSVIEGKKVDLHVSLATPPAAPVLLRVRRLHGPPGKIVVNAGALLRFTPANYATPRIVRFQSQQDPDAKNVSVTYQLKAIGYHPREVVVAVQDNEPSRPNFTSTPPDHAVVNLLYQYAVAVTGQPAPVFSLPAAPDGMTIDPATGLIAWTPTALGDFAVTVRATNKKGAVDQSYTLTVAADQPPTVFIIQPQDGDTISGVHSEFFGGSTDDYGTYKAEFYIDDVLRYTDINRNAHYHLNGAHNLFDTTALANGAHKLKMVVYDDIQQTAVQEIDVTVANP